MTLFSPAIFRKLVPVVLVALLTHGTAYTQAGSVSPYSRYALGDLYDMQMAHHTALGGCNIAFSDSLSVNVANPASFGQLARFNPVFDVGARGRLIRFYTNADSAKNYSLSLSNIVLAIPINKRMGMAFGLVPFSNAGYDITYNTTHDTLGNIRYVYQGNGGVNRAFVGYGVSPVRTKKTIFSLGLNASYLFGEVQKVRKVIYLSLGSGTYNTKIINSFFVKDFMLDFGMMFRHKVSNRVAFRLGTTYGMPMEIKASRSLLAHTFTSTFSENIVDTVAYEDNINGFFRLPVKWGYGMSFDILGKSEANPYKLTVILQFESQNWSNYEENFGNDVTYDFVGNSRALQGGVQYIPKAFGISSKQRISAFALSSYRVGYYHRKSYLTLQDQEITDRGVTFGIGIPLIYSGSFSMLNLSFEIGQRGTLTNNLILEKYVGVHLGYSYTPSRGDRWFLKRRFD